MINNIQIEKLIPHPNNPRKDLGFLDELAKSIKENGIMQNLTAVPTEDPEKFMVVIGHRRLAAAKKAGLKEVPCAIVEMEENKQLATMLIENIQRNDLTIYEQAKGFQLMMELGESIAEISQQTGFSHSTIYRRTNLLKLNQDEVKKGVLRGATLMDFAKLEGLKDEKYKNDMLTYIGTINFEYNLKNAIKEESSKEAKAILLEKIKEYATEIKSNETGECKYVIQFSKWNDYKGEHPTDANEKQYYYEVNGYGVTLYIKKEQIDNLGTKEDIERTEKQQIQMLKDELKNKLREKRQIAFECRNEFIKKITNQTAKKNMSIIINAMLETSKWCGVDIALEGLEDFMEIEIQENDEDVEKTIMEHVTEKKQTDVALLWMLAKSIDDADEGYHNWQCEHITNKGLDEYYNLLEYLGYKISAEEKQLQNGTHELFAKIKELED